MVKDGKLICDSCASTDPRPVLRNCDNVCRKLTACNTELNNVSRNSLERTQTPSLQVSSLQWSRLTMPEALVFYYLFCEIDRSENRAGVSSVKFENRMSCDVFLQNVTIEIKNRPIWTGSFVKVGIESTCTDVWYNYQKQIARVQKRRNFKTAQANE